MLEWYVLNYDWNKHKVVDYNIFGKDDVTELKKARRNKKFTNREELKNYLKRDFQYYYWSKAECEILVGDLTSRSFDDLEKIDIFRQIEMNLDRIVDYVISVCKFKF